MSAVQLVLSLVFPALLLAGAVRAQSTPVTVVVPQGGLTYQLIELTGTFTARQRASLSPRTSGLVSRVLVDAGDLVKRNQLLLELDSRLAELSLAQAEAGLNERQAALDEATRLREEGEDLGRNNHLPATEVRARVSAQALAAASVEVARSEVAAATERVARHQVVAPFAGIIVAKRTEAGEWVQTGTPVAELVATDALWLDVRMPQERWPALSDTAEIQVHVDSLPRRPLRARLHARVPVNDESSRTFLARLVVVEPPTDITPGMSARVRFELGGGEEVLKLPRDALIRYPDGTTTVWVIDGSGDAFQAREKEVTLGRMNGDQVEILAGLEPTQRVITRGNEILVEGQTVHITEAL